MTPRNTLYNSVFTSGRDTDTLPGSMEVGHRQLDPEIIEHGYSLPLVAPPPVMLPSLETLHPALEEKCIALWTEVQSLLHKE